jgi:hypothetical protein
VEQALRRQAAVALIGPGQVGKTTQALAIGDERNALYLDLEDRDDRNRLANPVLFLESAEDRLVILDEIHRMPALFDTLGGVIDRGAASRRARAVSSSWAPRPWTCCASPARAWRVASPTSR